ncbi:MAG: ubiquinone biosynthesis protein COQ4 [Myxococcota bacterium]|jgi:ubiquinone biosynthesis protein COQ4
MLSPLRIVRLAWHSLRLAIDPTSLSAVFGVVDAITTPEQLAALRADVAHNPGAAAALVTQPRLHHIDVDDLTQRPDGSLGRSFAAFVRANGIEPAVLTDRAVGDQDWVSIHLYETHDIWHVLTGIDTDPLGELELQAFVLAQLPSERLAAVAMGVGFLRAAIGHATLTPGNVLDAIGRGREAGQRAELLFGVDWSTQWDRPLAEVREALGLRVEPGVLAA